MIITPYSKNAKKHPQKQIDQLAAIVREVGWRQPILVNQEGVIVAGHGRWETYQQNKDLAEPWIIDDAGKTVMGEPASTPLTEEQEKAYRLADNKLAETDVDMGLVIEELKELEALGELAPLTGYDMDLTIEADEADDEVPDVPEEPQSKLGDLYELGEHRVLCGDSTKTEDVERLMDGKKADMVFTDPPYGISYSGKGVKGKAKANDFGEIIGDGDTEVAIDVYNLVLTIGIKDIVFWGANYYCNHLQPSMGWIVWDKKTVGDRYSDCELAWTNRKGRVMRLEHQWHGMIKASEQGEARKHPTQKPVFLAQWVFEKMNGGQKVLDLFLGSGSTLIASEKTGRICYGIELDPKYIDVIVQRYVDYVDNPVVKCNGKVITWNKTQNKEKTRSS